MTAPPANPTNRRTPVAHRGQDLSRGSGGRIELCPIRAGADRADDGIHAGHRGRDCRGIAQVALHDLDLIPGFTELVG